MSGCARHGMRRRHYSDRCLMTRSRSLRAERTRGPCCGMMTRQRSQFVQEARAKMSVAFAGRMYARRRREPRL
jgi:hypothetical protein